MKSLFFFIGTEAELIKVFPICVELDKKKVPYRFIFSGQNSATSSSLLQYCTVVDPIVLSQSKPHPSALGLLFWFFKTFFTGTYKLRKHLTKISPGSIIVVHGDTISTVMGAGIGRLFGLQVAHIEAGLRSHNWLHPFPEEIDRVITSYLANTHFCPNEWAKSNLSKVSGEKVITQGNTLLDSLQHVLKKNEPNVLSNSLKKSPYFIFALHRQENLADTKFVQDIISLIQQQSKKMKCVFILHEPTKVTLEKLNLLKPLEQNKNILLSPRIPYVQFMKVVKDADFLVSDGGSNQEECFYFGIPLLILRDHTERIEGLNENAVLSLRNFQTINDFFLNVDSYKRTPYSSSDSPSQIIADALSQKTQQKAT